MFWKEFMMFMPCACMLCISDEVQLFLLSFCSHNSGRQKLTMDLSCYSKTSCFVPKARTFILNALTKLLANLKRLQCIEAIPIMHYRLVLALALRSNELIYTCALLYDIKCKKMHSSTIQKSSRAKYDVSNPQKFLQDVLKKNLWTNLRSR